MTRILVVDDDKALCRSLEIQLGGEDHEVVCAYSAKEGIERFRRLPAEVVFCDLNLPDETGLSVLKTVLKDHPGCVVVMITGIQDTKATIEAVRAGAFDYIRKPFDMDTVHLVLEKARRHIGGPYGRTLEIPGKRAGSLKEIVGADQKIVNVIKEIGLLSQNWIPVLIEGESGTGKELVARALHEAACPEQKFVAINCSAVVSTLLESELFGHEKGAFTGAKEEKTGKLEYAGNGTVFFDEIGDMAVDLQAKLLRALQEREFERVGGMASIPFNARVVAATNRNIDELVAVGCFRRDLAYRLKVSRICVPPLRERRGDIPLLVKHLLSQIVPELHRKMEAIEEECIQELSAYDWPGNVRELENVLTRAVLLSRSSIISKEAVKGAMNPSFTSVPSSRSVRTLRDAEKDCIEHALLAKGWNITQCAKALEISPTTLRKKIHEYGLSKTENG